MCVLSGIQHSEALEDILAMLLLLDDQRALVAVAGDCNTRDEPDLAHILHGKAVFECFLELLHNLLAPSSDEDVVDVKTEGCEDFVATMRVHARVREHQREPDSQQYLVNDVML